MESTGVTDRFTLSISQTGLTVFLLFLLGQPSLAMSRLYECGDYIVMSRESEGVISSPGYPHTYTNLMDCIWLFYAPSGHGISLTIDPVMGEGGEHGHVNVTGCKDYLQVRDGSSTSQLLFRGCNTTDTVHVTSSNRWLWVQFKSDRYNNPGKGFSATFAKVTLNTTTIRSPVTLCQTINFQCRNKECVTWAYRCDGQNDCGCTGTGCDEADCGGFSYTRELRVAIGVGAGTIFFIIVFLVIGFIDYMLRARQAAENARLLQEEKTRGRRRGKSVPAAIAALAVQAPPSTSSNQNNSSNTNLQYIDNVYVMA